jgi:hypothetical protein
MRRVLPLEQREEGQNDEAARRAARREQLRAARRERRRGEVQVKKADQGPSQDTRGPALSTSSASPTRQAHAVDPDGAPAEVNEGAVCSASESRRRARREARRQERIAKIRGETEVRRRLPPVKLPPEATLRWKREAQGMELADRESRELAAYYQQQEAQMRYEMREGIEMEKADTWSREVEEQVRQDLEEAKASWAMEVLRIQAAEAERLRAAEEAEALRIQEESAEVQRAMSDMLYWVEEAAAAAAAAEEEQQQQVSEAITEAVALPVKKQQPRHRRSVGQSVDPDPWKEGLGEKYMDTAWKAPSLDLALSVASLEKFKGGKASLWSTGLEDLGSMGSGVRLYFSATRKLSRFMLVAAIMSTPAVWINGANETGYADTSSAGLGRYSLGNQGVSTATCPAGPWGCPQVIEGKIWQPESVSYFLMAVHLVLSLSLIGFTFVLSGLVKVAIADSRRENVSTSDYSIMVFGLPGDATHSDVVEHFSQRYGLSEVSPIHHGPLQRYGPTVAKSAQLGIAALFVGLIVGRILLAHGIDIAGLEAIVGAAFAFVAASVPFCRSPSLTAARPPVPGLEPVKSARHLPPGKLAQECRGSWVAEVSMIRENGEALRRCLSQMAVVGALMRARGTHKQALLLGGRRRLRRAKRAVVIAERDVKRAQRLAVGQDDTSTMARSCGAFVTFNHAESRVRCLTDYRYSWLPTKLLQLVQPRGLWYKAKVPLHVRSAEQPSSILWENLNVTRRERFRRRVMATTVAIALVGASCAVVAGLKFQQRLLEKAAPSSELCSTEIPALILGTYQQEEASYPFLVRADDGLCSAVGDVSLTLEGSDPAAPLPPLMTPSGGEVPRGPEICDGPCWNSKSTGEESCATLSCAVPEWNQGAERHKCYRFSPSAAWECFCMQNVGLTALLRSWTSQEGASDTEQCYARYASLVGLRVGVSIVIVFVNALLPQVLKFLAKAEHHPSASRQARSASRSLFLALFLNTGVALVLAGGGKILSRDWYASIGSALQMTMLLNIFTPHVAALFSALVLKPLRRKMQRKRAVIQDDLNALEAGPRFEVELRVARIISTVSVGWLYSSAMPMMLWFCCAALWLSRAVDKFMLLRVCSRPPQYDASLVGILSQYMPYIIVAQLLVCCIAFSDPQQEGQLLSPTIEALSQFTSWPQYFRVDQQNVAPFFFTAVAYVGYLLLASAARPVVGLLASSCWRREDEERRRQDEERKQDDSVAWGSAKKKPPFAGCFSKSLDKNQTFYVMANGNLARPDLEAGWRILPDPSWGESSNKLVRLWLEDGCCDGARHVAGDVRQTWEIICLDGLHSYLIGKNAKYQRALQLLYEDEENANKSAGRHEDQQPYHIKGEQSSWRGWSEADAEAEEGGWPPGAS